MHRQLGCLLVVILCVVLTSCTSKSEDVRVDNIVRVFWHEDSRYSVHVLPEGAREIDVQHYSIQCTSIVDGRAVFDKVRLIPDAPEGKKMWLVGKRQTSTGCDGFTNIEIHVHNAQSVEGAGWDHGKFGRGQTHVIE